MNRLINEAQILGDWSPVIREATGIEDQNKIKWLAEYCHYHKLAEDKGLLLEDANNYVHLNPGMNTLGMGAVAFPGDPGSNNAFHSQTQGSGDKPFSLLPLAMQVAAQTIGLDLVPVIPMGGPMGILTYLDFPYAGGALAVTGGADGKVAPIVIKSDITWDTGTLPGDPDTIFYATDGTNTPFKMTYYGTSRIDGKAIFMVEAFSAGTITSPTAFAPGTQIDTTLADVFNSGTSYYLSATIGGGSLTADLTESAELVNALEDHIPGFSGRGFANDDVDSVDPYEREEGESTQDNLMGLKLYSKSVSAKTVQAAAAVTREQVQDLKQYGIDAVQQVEAVLINELTQTINKHILDRIFRLGTTNAKQIFDNDATSLSLLVASTSTTAALSLGKQMDSNTAYSITTSSTVPTAGDNTGTLQRKILSKILAASNMIAIRGRRGAADFAVTNGQVATALQDIAGFVPYPMANTVNQQGGSLYPVGSVAGVTIYVDPNMQWSDTRIAVGRKGDGNGAGLVFMPYLMAESVSTIAEGTMAPKVAIKSRYNLVAAGHHPQTMYYTLRVQFNSGYAMI